MAYETTGGTAKPGEDYVPIKGVLKFRDDEASKQIAIKIVDDDSPEPGEHFNVVLSKPNNCSVGERGTTKVIIMDNDGQRPSGAHFGRDVHRPSAGVEVIDVSVIGDYGGGTGSKDDDAAFALRNPPVLSQSWSLASAAASSPVSGLSVEERKAVVKVCVPVSFFVTCIL